MSRYAVCAPCVSAPAGFGQCPLSREQAPLIFVRPTTSPFSSGIWLFCMLLRMVHALVITSPLYLVLRGGPFTAPHRTLVLGPARIRGGLGNDRKRPRPCAPGGRTSASLNHRGLDLCFCFLFRERLFGGFGQCLLSREQAPRFSFLWGASTCSFSSHSAAPISRESNLACSKSESAVPFSLRSFLRLRAACLSLVMDYAQANPGGALNPAQLLALRGPDPLIHFPPGHGGVWLPEGAASFGK